MDKDFASSLSVSRQELLKKFLAHDWFKATSEEIQKELISLPEDYNGFLDSLVVRPDEIGEVDVQKITKIGYGHYMIMPVFEVRSNVTNQIFTYEYVSWKTGVNPGMKGIIFLENQGEITHFLIAQSHKFSTASSAYDGIGGLYLRVLDNKIINFPKKIETEIKFHLGVDKVEFKKIYELGKCHPDHGMTNNETDLYAAIIDISHLPNLIVKENFRETHKPIGYEIKIVHISEFTDYIQSKVEDNYFLSAAARILTHKDISLPL